MELFRREPKQKPNKKIGKPVTLADLPAGDLFFFNGTLGLKSEYMTNDGLIEAYIVGSGEFFWGGAKTVEEHRQLIVFPIILSTAYGHKNIIMELNSELERLAKYNVIDAELQRAKKKHPNYPTDIFHQLAIMQEEAGEVTQAVLHLHYEKGTVDHVREELIQTAAMCMRMLENLPQ